MTAMASRRPRRSDEDRELGHGNATTMATITIVKTTTAKMTMATTIAAVMTMGRVRVREWWAAAGGEALSYL